MVGKNSSLATSIAALLILLLILASTGPAARSVHAVAVGAPAPSWVVPGDSVEYNQTYTIDGLTASININETFLKAANAEMHLVGFDPQIPSGFAEPGLVAPFDSGDQQITTVITSSNRTTTIIGGGGFTTDLTAFIDQDLVTRTNATLDLVQVHALGNHTVQAWKVDENALYNFIAGQPPLPGQPVDRSLLWFEKDTLMKIRSSDNYTDQSSNYVVSIRTLEDTNIPQLEAALAGQEMNSTQPTTTGALSSSNASGTAQSPSDPTGWAALATVVLLTIFAVAYHFVRGRNIPWSPERQVGASLTRIAPYQASIAPPPSIGLSVHVAPRAVISSGRMGHLPQYQAIFGMPGSSRLGQRVVRTKTYEKDMPKNHGDS